MQGRPTLHPEKPTLALSNHPENSLRIVPFLYQLVQEGKVHGGRELAIVANVVFKPVFALPVIRECASLIPVVPKRRDFNNSTAALRLLQKLMIRLDEWNKTPPDHQGKFVTKRVVQNLRSGNNVYMAPTGSLSQEAPWRTGIYYIYYLSKQTDTDYALSMSLIPSSFREKHASVLLDHWIEAAGNADFDNTADPHEQAILLQQFYNELFE